MKKEDLKNGAILETRSGEHCFVIGDDLYFIESGLETNLYRYYDNLKEMCGFVDDDIMKVCIDPMKSNKWDWERKETTKLTDDERAILKLLNPKWKWLVYYEGQGITLADSKPILDIKGYWTYKDKHTEMYLCAFHKDMFTNFKDKELYNIEELLKGSEEDEEDRTSEVRP